MPTGSQDVRSSGYTGSDGWAVRTTRLTHMYGPAVRCKRFVDLVVSGLASMYPVSSWSCFAPDQYGYQRACDLINGQASTGPCGSPVFACAGKTDPPSLLILSQTSAGKGIDYVIDSLLGLRCSFVRAWRPFLRPDLRVQRCAGRRDRQGWPSRLPCLSRQRCQATP